MKILLTGAKGQLGRCFQDMVAAHNAKSDRQVELLATGSAELDICDKTAVDQVFAEFQPNFVVNAAAYTAVDKAEAEVELADKINHQGPKNLAEAAKTHNSWLLHISTDYVFDGNAVEPYRPDGRPCPQSVYGATKFAGERAVSAVCEKYMIFRTAWVFSEYGNNFVKTMLRLAKERDELSVVADQYGCPTYAGDIAKALFEICVSESLSQVDAGIYHICGKHPTSWHGFARTIFELGRQAGAIESVPKLTAIPSSAYPTPAKRPEYSVLHTSKSPQDVDLSPDWLVSLKHVINRLRVEQG